jgi:hypothetical protein
MCCSQNLQISVVSLAKIEIINKILHLLKKYTKKKIYFISPNDFRVTSLFTAPT